MTVNVETVESYGDEKVCYVMYGLTVSGNRHYKMPGAVKSLHILIQGTVLDK